MIGEGPLLKQCQDLAATLGVSDAITFLGGQDHSIVQGEMKSARCFVQHSILAPSGDCEGTPVSILEAGAAGLPVVSTRHAGIPDVVVEGKTGFLVDEEDEVGMADHMIDLARHPDLAARMGKAAREHVRENFSMDRSLDNLWAIIQSCISSGRIMST
jgi:glycosyltransferase involved in cell wall biosynthesis